MVYIIYIMLLLVEWINVSWSVGSVGAVSVCIWFDSGRSSNSLLSYYPRGLAAVSVFYQ